MSIAALAERLRSEPVPPVPCPKLHEGTDNRLLNQSGTPSSPSSPEKKIEAEKTDDVTAREPAQDSGKETLIVCESQCRPIDLTDSEVTGNHEKPRHCWIRWLLTLPDGEKLSIRCTPLDTLADLQERYPDARIEPEGSELDPHDAAIIGAWLGAIGETDPTIRTEILTRAAVEPQAIAPGASCGRCRHFERDRINPPGGLGRCRCDAPASHRPGSLWPRGEIQCGRFEEVTL